MTKDKLLELVQAHGTACVTADRMGRPLLRRNARETVEKAIDEVFKELYALRAAPTAPLNTDPKCRCGHHFSQHSDKDIKCYECQCDFAQVP